MIENCRDWCSSWLSNLVTLYICRFVLVLSWTRHLCKNWLNGMNSLEKVEVDPKTIGIWEELDFVFFVSEVHIRIQTCQYIIDKKKLILFKIQTCKLTLINQRNYDRYEIIVNNSISNIEVHRASPSSGIYS
jgi:hypothetical protein